MFRILVTGANGQLGAELKILHTKCLCKTFFFKSKEELDIANKQVVENFCIQNNINIIINCAAYTAVDKADSEFELADIVNHKAVKYLAEIANDNNIKLIHISTDYVFNGRSYRPYNETDRTNPQNIYGKTKCDGEKAILQVSPRNSCIIRTSWLYSSIGNNFVKTMLRLGKEKVSLGVVADQVGSPTYAKDLAEVILVIAVKLNNKKTEVYHYSNEGAISWYDFAKEIMLMSKLDCNINPIETADYPTIAARPHYSVLNKKKIKQHFDLNIPHWKESLDMCLKTIKERE